MVAKGVRSSGVRLTAVTGHLLTSWTCWTTPSWPSSSWRRSHRTARNRARSRTPPGRQRPRAEGCPQSSPWEPGEPSVRGAVVDRHEGVHVTETEAHLDLGPDGEHVALPQ